MFFNVCSVCFWLLCSPFVCCCLFSWSSKIIYFFIKFFFLFCHDFFTSLCQLLKIVHSCSVSLFKCLFAWCWQNSSVAPFFCALTFASALHLSQRSAFVRNSIGGGIEMSPYSVVIFLLLCCLIVF